jgi:hypothetical protein
MASSPDYFSSPVITTAVLNTANLNTDGTGSIIVIANNSTSAPASLGASVSKGIQVLEAQACHSFNAASTAAQVRFFYRSSSAGTWRILPGVITLAGVTPNATTAPSNGIFGWDNLVLPPEAELGASITALTASHTVTVTVFAGNRA